VSSLSACRVSPWRSAATTSSSAPTGFARSGPSFAISHACQ
jgi:hypothetical protein